MKCQYIRNPLDESVNWLDCSKQATYNVRYDESEITYKMCKLHARVMKCSFIKTWRLNKNE